MATTMESDRHCPRCGTALPKNAPEGLCPTCLIQAGVGTDPGATKTDPGHRPNQPPPSPQEIAPHFSQLEILELLGQGGMGIVYKARQPKLDRIVALKILPLELGRDPAFAERFAREARALARLNHPHIVAIYDFGEVNGLYYFLMEHVDGVDLRQLENAGRLSPEQALAMVPAICDALQYAHEEGIVHRDIKPGNILIDRKGRVKIADFGLAKLVGSTAGDLSLTDVGQSMGTPHYMAPEQIHHTRQVDHRADIYSLGVVFYEMLTGELPVGRFAAPSRKVQVDVRLDDIVLRALENNPERRYQQAGEIKTDIESITQHPPPRIAPQSNWGPKPSPASPVPNSFQRAQRIVQGPGIALMVLAMVSLVSLILLPVLPAWLRWPIYELAHPVVPLPVVPLAAAICLLVGACKMRNLTSYNWSLAAALLALLPPPLSILSWHWPAGLGLGIWALIAIHHPEVKSAFGRDLPGEPPHLTAGTGPIARPVNPVISRKAIVGACLVAVFVLFELLRPRFLMWKMGQDHSFHILNTIHSGLFQHQFPFLHPHLPWWIVVGIPIATTILGLLAIKDIRYSNGQIIGLSLALGDTLLFPLLLLNGLVFLALHQASRNVGPDTSLLLASPTLREFIIFLSALSICVILDYLIVRSCWRAVRQPVV